MRVDAAASGLDPKLAARLKRNEDGLVAAIAQQHDTGEVLMLGWMDDEALARTLTTGRCTYWSRSRREYWVKGETSGQRGLPYRRPHLLRRWRPAQQLNQPCQLAGGRSVGGDRGLLGRDDPGQAALRPGQLGDLVIPGIGALARGLGRRTALMQERPASSARQGDRDTAVLGAAVAPGPGPGPDGDCGEYQQDRDHDGRDLALVPTGDLLRGWHAGEWHYRKYKDPAGVILGSVSAGCWSGSGHEDGAAAHPAGVEIRGASLAS